MGDRLAADETLVAVGGSGGGEGGRRELRPCDAFLGEPLRGRPAGRVRRAMGPYHEVLGEPQGGPAGRRAGPSGQQTAPSFLSNRRAVPGLTLVTIPPLGPSRWGLGSRLGRARAGARALKGRAGRQHERHDGAPPGAAHRLPVPKVHEQPCPMGLPGLSLDGPATRTRCRTSASRRRVGLDAYRSTVAVWQGAPQRPRGRPRAARPSSRRPTGGEASWSLRGRRPHRLREGRRDVVRAVRARAGRKVERTTGRVVSGGGGSQRLFVSYVAVALWSSSVQVSDECWLSAPVTRNASRCRPGRNTSGRPRPSGAGSKKVSAGTGRTLPTVT